MQNKKIAKTINADVMLRHQEDFEIFLPFWKLQTDLSVNLFHLFHIL